MLAGQGVHFLIDIRPHHGKAFSTMAKNAMIRLMLRNSAPGSRSGIRGGAVLGSSRREAPHGGLLQRFSRTSLQEFTS